MIEKQNRGILLRLPKSLGRAAVESAHADNTSLNFFITQAVAEKIERMQARKLESTSVSVSSEKEQEGQAAAGPILAS